MKYNNISLWRLINELATEIEDIHQKGENYSLTRFDNYVNFIRKQVLQNDITTDQDQNAILITLKKIRDNILDYNNLNLLTNFKQTRGNNAN